MPDHLGNMVDTVIQYGRHIRKCGVMVNEHLEIDEIMKAVVERLEHLAVTV